MCLKNIKKRYNFIFDIWNDKINNILQSLVQQTDHPHLHEVQDVRPSLFSHLLSYLKRLLRPKREKPVF